MAGADFVMFTFDTIPKHSSIRDVARMLHALPAFRAIPTDCGSWRPAFSTPSQHIIESADAADPANLAELAKGLAGRPIPWWRLVHGPDGAWAVVASLWYASSSQWTAILYDICGDTTPFPFEQNEPDPIQRIAFHMAPFLCTFAFLAALWLVLTAHRYPHPHGWVCIAIVYVGLCVYQLWPVVSEVVIEFTTSQRPSVPEAASVLYETVPVSSSKGQLRSLMLALAGPLRVVVDRLHGVDPRATDRQAFADMAEHARSRQDCAWDSTRGGSIRDSNALGAASALTVLERAGINSSEFAWKTFVTAITCPSALFEGMAVYVLVPQGKSSACVLNCKGRRRLSMCGSTSAIGELRAQVRHLVCA